MLRAHLYCCLFCCSLTVRTCGAAVIVRCKRGNTLWTSALSMAANIFNFSLLTLRMCVCVAVRLAYRSPYVCAVEQMQHSLVDCCFHSLSSRKVTQVFGFIAAIAEILSVSDAVNLQSPILNSNCRWSDRKSPPFASQKLRRLVFMALPKQMSLMLYFSRGFAQQMAQRAWNGRMLAVPIVVAVNVSKIIFSCNMWRLKFLIKYSGQFSSKSSSLIVSLCSEKIVDPWS